MGCLILALLDGAQHGWSVWTVLCVACGALAIGGFVASERRAVEPLVARELWRSRPVIFANSLWFVGEAMFFGTFLLLAFLLQDVLGYSPQLAGVATLGLGLGFSFGVGGAHLLQEALGARSLLVGAFLINAAGLGLLAWAPADANYFWDVLPGLLLVSVGGGCWVFVLQGFGNVGGENSGMASGLLAANAQLGAALGVAVLVAISVEQSQAAGATDATLAGFSTAALVASVFYVFAAAAAARWTPDISAS